MQNRIFYSINETFLEMGRIDSMTIMKAKRRCEMTLSSIFIVIFISTLALLFFHLILGGVLDSVISIESDFFNVTTTLCFLGVASVLGYLLLYFTEFSDLIVVVFAIIISIVLTILLNIFVFIPLSKMESTTSFKIEDMQGEVGEVTLTIPVDSIGEVTVKTPLGMVSRTAKSYNNEEILQGEQALIIEVHNQVFLVVKYDADFNYTNIKKSGGD